MPIPTREDVGDPTRVPWPTTSTASGSIRSHSVRRLPRWSGLRKGCAGPFRRSLLLAAGQLAKSVPLGRGEHFIDVGLCQESRDVRVHHRVGPLGGTLLRSCSPRSTAKAITGVVDVPASMEGQAPVSPTEQLTVAGISGSSARKSCVIARRFDRRRKKGFSHGATRTDQTDHGTRGCPLPTPALARRGRSRSAGLRAAWLSPFGTECWWCDR